MHSLYYLFVVADNGGFVQIYDCTCNGHPQIYECTAQGGGFTIWQGSAFDCEQNQNIIRLRHTAYTTKAVGDCNDGAIMASSIGISNNNHYISMLSITVGQEMNNETVECVHHPTQGAATIIGQTVLMITDSEGKCCNLTYAVILQIKFRTIWTT